MKKLSAADVMHSEIVTINTDASILDAVRLMLARGISGLPVVDRDQRLVGIITEGDLLRRSEIGTERHRSRWLELLTGPGRAAEDYALAHGRKVSEIMSDQIVTVAADRPLEEIVALMEGHAIKRVPVLEGQRLVGMVSRADLLRALVDRSASTRAAPEVSDEAIRQRIQEAIDRESWSPRATIRVAVQNGIVELGGCITDERERVALTVLAENVPGVSKVLDHMVWIEPLSGMVLDPNSPEPAGQVG